MAPTRRRPATAAGGGGASTNPGGKNSKDNKAPLSPADNNGSPGLPLVVSPRGPGGGNNSHHHHHHKNNQNLNTNQSLTSLDLDALDDEAAAARFDAMSESVVKIFCIHSEPAFNQPW